MCGDGDTAGELAALVSEFLLNVLEDCEMLARSVERREYSTAAVIGHQLRGCGAAFGFPEISAWGTTIEVAAELGDREKVDMTEKQLRSFVRAQLSEQTKLG